MFVGHYGPSFAVKGVAKAIPLWVLVLAVQFVDVLWAIFVLLGVEKVRIVPGITASNPLDLYYAPYTHSLVGAIGWALAAAVAYKLVPRFRATWREAALVGAAVFSHWPLDWLVHRPDLPLYGGVMKMGLGMWDHPVPAFLLEAAVLFGGIALYYRSTRQVARGGRWGMVVFAVVMLLVQLSTIFGPPPPSGQAVAVTALVSFLAVAGVAAWLETKRA